MSWEDEAKTRRRVKVSNLNLDFFIVLLFLIKNASIKEVDKTNSIDYYCDCVS